TDCADVLRRAELPPGGGGSGSNGSGSSGVGTSGANAAAGGAPAKLLSPSTDADRKALAKAATTGDQPLQVNGQRIVPGATGLHPRAARNTIPGTLVAALILLGIAGGALTVPAVRRQLPRFGRK